jgi:cytochrome c biogenesis factor
MNELEFNRITAEMAAILRRKNSDYGGTVDNISITGLTGISVRVLDKAMRLYNLTKSQESQQQVKEESIRDTLIDLANYCVIGVMLLDGTWNKISIKR